MNLGYAVLALLDRKAAHGYQLRSDLVDAFGADWDIDIGQLYRVLGRIETLGWVRSKAEAGDGGPPRKVYRVTVRGRAALQAWSRSLDLRVTRGRDPSVILEFVARDAAPIRLIGSDDPLLTELAQRTGGDADAPRCLVEPIGSLGGLWALRQRRADVVGMHLFDPDSGSYNVPFLRSLLPEEETIVIHLARREQGFIVARGNPHRVRSAADVVERRLRYVNRQREAGTRLFAWRQFRRCRVDPRTLDGYDREAATHGEVADLVQRGAVDVGPGVRAATVERDVDFVALGEESFDVVIPQARWKSKRLTALVDVLQSAEFKRYAAQVPGYDTAALGRVVARTGR